MNWQKTGLIYRCDRAQLPVISQNNGRTQVFYSDRDNDGRSFGNLLDAQFDSNYPTHMKLSSLANKVLIPGDVGNNDAAGAMPMQLINDKLFYIGWSRRQDVPYYNITHIAIQKNNQFQKLGPILPPDTVDNSFSGTLHVIHLKDRALWIGYYLSCDRWIYDEFQSLQPSYDIKIATSHNLIQWKKLGQIAIKRENQEQGLSSATVIEYGGKYHMWFSARSGTHFRNGIGAYEIKHAVSMDAINWNRTENYGLSPNLTHQENMCAYPSIIEYKGILHMLYNGWSFGKRGIFHAWMPKVALNTH